MGHSTSRRKGGKGEEEKEGKGEKKKVNEENKDIKE